MVLVNIAYADTAFAADLNNTNNTNITDSYQVSGLNQKNKTDLTNSTQTNKTNNTQTNNTNIAQTSTATIKSTNVVKVQSVVTVQNIQGVFINPADTPVTSINPST